MTEEFKAKVPDYKGSGIDIWKAIDKNGNMYLKVKVLNGTSIACFKYNPKPKITTQKMDL